MTRKLNRIGMVKNARFKENSDNFDWFVFFPLDRKIWHGSLRTHKCKTCCRSLIVYALALNDVITSYFTLTLSQVMHNCARHAASHFSCHTVTFRNGMRWKGASVVCTCFSFHIDCNVVIVAVVRQWNGKNMHTTTLSTSDHSMRFAWGTVHFLQMLYSRNKW